MNYPQKILDWVLDAVFPIRCVNCRKFGSYLCSRCLNQVEIRKSFECVGCKRNVSLGQTCYLCRKDNHIDHLFIATNLKDPIIDKVVKAFKYKFLENISEPIVMLARKYLKWLGKKEVGLFSNNPLILSVPLTQKRHNWRGFNQSEIIARKISGYFQMEFSPTALVRVKESTPQADIELKEDRLKNTIGLFACSNPKSVSGREIILVDDVCTTGATLNECAKVLKSNGASKVSALVIARG